MAVRLPFAGWNSSDPTKENAVWTVLPNGNFGGLEAEFARDGERMDVYIQVPRDRNEKTGKRELAPDDDDLLPKWRGEDYYHEAYALLGGQWRMQTREFARQWSRDTMNFGDCDYLDRKDISVASDIRTELPNGIKMKAVLRFPEYLVAIYSDPNERGYADDHPPLEMSLLVPDRPGWRIAAGQEADEYGYFCGASSFLTTLASGQTARILLVHAADPSVDSEYFNIYSFLVQKSVSALRPAQN